MTREERQRMLARAIARIEDEHGRASPTRLWEAARNPRHELHDEFNWNIEEAAQQAWEARARELIREVRIEVVYGERRIATPAYVSDPRTTTSSYARTLTISRSSSTKRLVLKAEIDRISSLINRAMGLAAVFGLTGNFQAALDQIVEAGISLGDGEGDDDPGVSGEGEGPRPAA